MLFSLDQNTAMLALLLLLGISLLTIEICRRDKRAGDQTEGEFLFAGKGQIHSLASSVGALFSLTYLFGASFVYGFVFGVWYLLVALVVMGVLVVLLRGMLDRLPEPSNEGRAPASNILLDYLRQSLGEQDFRTVVRLYAIVYFLLLVEELAVSRMVISNLLPSHPAASTLALSVICLVVYAYLVYGGFRAVLNSDVVQMVVVAGFLLCLVFLMVKDSGTIVAEIKSPTLLQANQLPTIAFTILFGVCWFAAGVDFFSRLNFTLRPRESGREQRKRFVVVGLALIFLVLLIGLLYGVHLRGVLPEIGSPASYTAAAVEHFLTMQRPAVVVFFVCGIFCMAFTTIDTLLLTLLQVGSYSKLGLLERRRASQLLFIAVALSCFLQFDSVSAFGIFAGSLIIIPAVGVLKAFVPRLDRIAPPTLRSLEWALVIAAIVFAATFDRLKLAFEEHFLIPGLVLATTIACFLASSAASRSGVSTR